MTIVGGAAPSHADLEAAESILQLQGNELNRVRDRAAKWRDGLIVLVGLFGTVAIFKGRDSIADLPVWAQRSIGVLMILALAFAIGSGVLAILAAFGWSATPHAVGPVTGLHERLLRLDRQAALRAITQLKIAAGLTLASLAAMTVAVGLGFFAASPTGTACVRIVAATGMVTVVQVSESTKSIKIPDDSILEYTAC